MTKAEQLRADLFNTSRELVDAKIALRQAQFRVHELEEKYNMLHLKYLYGAQK